MNIKVTRAELLDLMGFEVSYTGKEPYKFPYVCPRGRENVMVYIGATWQNEEDLALEFFGVLIGRVFDVAL